MRYTNIPFVFSAFPAKSVFCHRPDEFWPSVVTSCSKAVRMLDPLLRLTIRLSDHPYPDKYPSYRKSFAEVQAIRTCSLETCLV